MTPKLLVYTFVAAVAAVFLGWFGGTTLNSYLAEPYDIAVGVVETRVAETETLAPATTLPTPSGSPEEEEGDCPQPPPGENCDCQKRVSGKSRWFCSLDEEAVPSETPGVIDRLREKREKRQQERFEDDDDD